MKNIENYIALLECAVLSCPCSLNEATMTLQTFRFPMEFQIIPAFKVA